MKGHIEKAKHNEKFLEFIETNVTDDFHDWRITVIFYSGLHYMKALLKLKKIPSGHSHTDLDIVINPNNNKAKYPLPTNVYNLYQSLYQNARNSRYDAHLSNDFQILLMKVKTDESKKSLTEIKKYIKKEGLKF